MLSKQIRFCDKFLIFNNLLLKAEMICEANISIQFLGVQAFFVREINYYVKTQGEIFRY